MDKYKYKSDKKTFIWHMDRNHGKRKSRGQFKIDNHYNIISGKYKGKHYRDILPIVDRMFMVYGYHAGMATLEWIK